MGKLGFIIIFIFSQFIYCSRHQIMDIKIIEGIWEVHSVSSKDEVFYPKGNSPLVDYYSLNSDSTGVKKKLKPNFNKTFSSSYDKVKFRIVENNGFIYLNYHSNSNDWIERIEKLTENELVISNNKFEYHYKRFENK